MENDLSKVKCDNQIGTFHLLILTLIRLSRARFIFNSFKLLILSNELNTRANIGQFMV